MKHLIFHTWPTLYNCGNELCPESIRWKLIRLKTWWTGKSQPQRMLEYVQADSKCRSSNAILEKLDYYGWNIEWHMSLGDEKCPIIKDIISRNLKQQKDPKRRVKLLECGSYSGYSTVLFGEALPENGLIISTEIDHEFSAISKKLYDLSGLQTEVNFIAADTKTALSDLPDVDYFDFVFLDHEKEDYLPTLLKLTELKLIRKDSVIIADNAIYPGCPELLVYVRTAPKLYLTTLHPCIDAYSPTVQDGIEEIICLTDP